MSSHSHFVPTHHLAHRTRRVEDVRTLDAVDVHTRLSAMLIVMGGIGVLAGIWGGIAPFIGPTFNYSADGSGSWHWDLARGILAALPGAAVFVAGLLVIACARSVAIGIGRWGVAIAGVVMFASAVWFAIGPAAWPALWGRNYFVHSTANMNLARSAGFSAGPGVVIALVAGLMIGSMVLRDRVRLVADEEHVRPIDAAGARNSALNDDTNEAVEPSRVEPSSVGSAPVE
jgi:hypothetical protein